MPILRKFASPPKISNEKRSVGPPGPPAAIGEAFGGGFFAGQISYNADGIATHNLVIAPYASGTSALITWKTSQTNDPSITSEIDGAAMSALMNSATYPAGEFCETLSVGGFSDWYMPARYEAAILGTNFKLFDNNNTLTMGVGGNGTNIYSVPPRTVGYTNGPPRDPTITTSAAFRYGGEQQPTDLFPRYWVSTQYSAGYAQYINLYNCNSGTYGKTRSDVLKARPIRKVPV